MRLYRTTASFSCFFLRILYGVLRSLFSHYPQATGTRFSVQMMLRSHAGHWKAQSVPTNTILSIHTLRVAALSPSFRLFNPPSIFGLQHCLRIFHGRLFLLFQLGQFVFHGPICYNLERRHTLHSSTSCVNVSFITLTQPPSHGCSTEDAKNRPLCYGEPQPAVRHQPPYTYTPPICSSPRPSFRLSSVRVAFIFSSKPTVLLLIHFDFNHFRYTIFKDFRKNGPMLFHLNVLRTFYGMVRSSLSHHPQATVAAPWRR